ncbi:uncharacterized protein LOC105847246 isoform X3 [Hydra vulgaris]|uniref:Uncharacterized protein LOC105847246 isoform X3 n=1 Tax=Hydra vulgaris TaxID=6087 RepID=A0ABM4C729_HYDVU
MDCLLPICCQNFFRVGTRLSRRQYHNLNYVHMVNMLEEHSVRLLWGYLLDKINSKTVLLISGIFQTISTLLFGFSTSFYWTLVTRFMQGAFKVAGLASKVIVIHNSNDTNIALAFAILFGSETFGNIVGPSFSGFLVFLVEQYPKNFQRGGFFDLYKIFLPNVIFTICLAISTLVIFIYLPSSSSNREQNIDPVKVIYDESSQSLNENLYFNISYEQNHHPKSIMSEETKLIPSKKNGTIHQVTQRLITFKFVQIFMDKDCLNTMIVYAILGVVGIGYMELFIIFAATSAEFEGLSMSSSHIGLLLMFCAVIDIVGSVTISPKIVQKVGAKKAFIYWIIGCGCIYSFIPALVLISNNGIRWFSLVACLGTISIVINGCFISVNIFVSNSVLPEFQGTFTGLAMSVSCIGRAAGPVLFGNAYSWSLSNLKSKNLPFPFNQYFAFLLLATVCLISALFTHFLISQSLNNKKVPSNKKLEVRGSYYLYVKTFLPIQ